MISVSSIKLSIPHKQTHGFISVPISKSEVNRLLILQALSNGRIKLKHTSSANDTKVIERALNANETTINVEDAGTAMRFLTAYFCVKNEHKILRGTERMHERPIGELVKALRNIGFDIRYLEKKHYPPIEILPVDFSTLRNETEISGNISSQFISALMLIGAFLPNGLTINIKDGTISKSYITLTASMLEKGGIIAVFSNNRITLKPQLPAQQVVAAGADWTNASYWYAFAALSERSEITINHLQQETAQGDIAIVELGKLFGVETAFEADKIVLRKSAQKSDFPALNLDFSNNPDLAQTIIVLCAGLNISATFTGLQSLRIKETDRIAALQNELKKCGLELYEKSINVFALRGKFRAPTLPIKTYHDHRMAMAFAPLCLLCQIEIEDPDVVRKSYPEFWDEIRKLY